MSIWSHELGVYTSIGVCWLGGAAEGCQSEGYPPAPSHEIDCWRTQIVSHAKEHLV